jgi:hypothetical protein
MIKKYLIFGVVGVVVFYLLNKFKKPINNEKIKDSKMNNEPTYFFKINKTGNLINDFITFVQLKEGGLSRHKEDSASAYPSPYTFADKKGGIYKDWHTNKGVTYKVFETLSKKLGYVNNEYNFKNMPNDIWIKIFKNGYYKPYENLTNSELINLYVSLWAWGSGQGGANSLLKKIGIDLQKMIDTKGEDYTLKFLINERIKFFERLVKAKPQNAKFLQGWKNGALSFYKNFSTYAKN